MEMEQVTKTPTSRLEKLLAQEISACEDPVCCCEPEPRWLEFERMCLGQVDPGEWEALKRSPADEL
jgi:hypothetical protein